MPGWISWVTLAGTTVAAVIVFQRWGDQILGSLQRLSLPALAAVILAALGLSFLNSLVLWESLVLFRIRMSLRECFIVASANSLWAYLPGNAGLGIKALYLRRKAGLRYGEFVAVTVATLVLQILLGAGVALGILLLRGIPPSPAGRGFAVVLAAIGVTCAIVLSLSPPTAARTTRFKRSLVQIIEGWNDVLAHPYRLMRITALMLIRTILYGLMIFLCARALDVPFSILDCCMLAAVGSFYMVVNLTPGGLGIREAIQVGTAMAIGHTPAMALAVVLLATATVVAVTFVIGTLSAALTVRWLRAA